MRKNSFTILKVNKQIYLFSKENGLTFEQTKLILKYILIQAPIYLKNIKKQTANMGNYFLLSKGFPIENLI